MIRYHLKFYNIRLCAQLRVCSQAGGIPVYPRFSQPDNSESWDCLLYTSDYMVQSKITDAREQVDDAINRIEKILADVKNRMNGEV